MVTCYFFASQKRKITMSFAIAITVLLALLTALSKPVMATEWPTTEIRQSCPKLVKEILQDSTIAYYGCGEKDIPSTNHRENAERSSKLDSQIRGLETTGLTNAEIIKTLHEAWSSRIHQEVFQKTYRYEGADLLFRELYSALLKSPFSYESTWPHNDIDYEVRKVIETMRWAGRFFGKHYGKLVLDLMIELTNKYPKNELLVEAQRYALESMIFPPDPPISGREEEETTAEEKRLYAEKLYDFYSSRQELRSLHLLDKEKSLLNELAPDLLQNLEILVASRQAQ